MKMPRFADLDEEQRKIYQGAPPDGSIVVVGPPGTGKTVMAFHRATALKRLGQSPRLIMFNSVLSRYVEVDNPHAKDVPISTMHKWVQEWYRAMGLGQLPMKEMYVHDWYAIAKAVNARASGPNAAKVNWGHLVVDEGQDFPPEMYQALAMLVSMDGVKDSANQPALTVFADENQRLWQNNSAIHQIRAAVSLTQEDRFFRLTKNYRNTRQIAELAAHFYCGTSTGVPDLPDREGPTPIASFHRNQMAMLAAIKGLLEEMRGQGLDVGIICPRERTRYFIYSSLCEEYEGDDDIRLQSFKSRDKELTAKSLVFDKGGSVTVLCRESVKGLEFDAVFVIDPFLQASAASSTEQQFKMNMYVSCSRAREFLQLMFVTDRDEVMRRLPLRSSNLYDLQEA